MGAGFEGRATGLADNTVARRLGKLREDAG